MLLKLHATCQVKPQLDLRAAGPGVENLKRKSERLRQLTYSPLAQVLYTHTVSTACRLRRYSVRAVSSLGLRRWTTPLTTLAAISSITVLSTFKLYSCPCHALAHTYENTVLFKKVDTV